MPFKFYGVAKNSEVWIVLLIILTILVVGWPYYYLLSHQGVFNKLTYFVTTKFPFYISSLVSLRIIYWYKKKYQQHKYHFKEFLITIPIVFIANFGYTAVLFFWSTNLYDTEIWNGHTQESEYYESWTEEREDCTTDDDGNTTCTTYYVYHPPYWQLITNNDEIVSISSATYRKYVSLFQNEVFTRLSNPGQVSVGDGNMYSVSFNGDSRKLVPTAISHVYVNFIRAADPVFLYTGYTAQYADDLVSYPATNIGEYGPIYINRVLDPNTGLHPTWKEELNYHLCQDLAYLGKEKQVNVLVYATKRDTTFYKALHEMWYGGKKNDVIVVLGTQDFPTLDWVRVMSWTDSKSFKNSLEQKIKALPDLMDATQLGKTITDQISKTPEEGGFVRKPMEEFNALRDDIHLGLKAYLIGIFISLLIQLPLMLIFIFVDIE